MRRHTAMGVEGTPRTRWPDGALVLLAVSMLGTSCATTGDRRGAAGTVLWEIVWDAPAGRVQRYTVILTETAGRRVELDYVESRADTWRFGPDGPTAVRPVVLIRFLGETLTPFGERRIGFEFPSLWVSEVRHEFHGRIDGTQSVRVVVRVRALRQ